MSGSEGPYDIRPPAATNARFPYIAGIPFPRHELENPPPIVESQHVTRHDQCIGAWASRRREQSVEFARAVDLLGDRPHLECSRCGFCIPPFNRLARITWIPHDSKVRYVRTHLSEQFHSLP